MEADRVEVVVRCKNEMPYCESTLGMLRDERLRVIVFDSGSTDGSREVALEAGFEVVDIEPASYVPGRVLNQAMELTRGPVVSFVNADAIPRSVEAVLSLVETCRNGAAAAFGRQTPRRFARPTTKADHARVFPTSPDGPGFRHFFSMAASAIRRDVWAVLPFDEDIRYSEDVDWTLRLLGLGCRIQYVPEAEFEHSHDYEGGPLWRRMKGEGMAERLIYRAGPPSPIRHFALPLAAQLLRDARTKVGSPKSVTERVVAQGGRFWGRWSGRNSPPWAAGPRPIRSGDSFTSDRIPEAEAMIARVLDEAKSIISAGLGSDLEALLLLGGYAGGEGTVDWKPEGPHVHNDLDLVAIVSSSRKARALRSRCLELTEEASERTGTCVDVYPVARAELARSKGKLLWLDAAVRGVRVVAGDPTVLDPLANLHPRGVVSGEIGRLIINRATGLAVSRLSFMAGDDEESRAARHVAKAWMALGDALLLFEDRYASTGAERLANLTNLSTVAAPWVQRVLHGYTGGLEYRRNPHAHRLSWESFQIECKAMWPAFRALEAHRLGFEAWLLPSDYASEAQPRFPELVDVSYVGRMLGGPRAALKSQVPLSQGWRHPREVLARVCVLVAFGDEQDVFQQAGRWLGLRTTDPRHLRNRLETLREIGA
jgi:rhamnosyltransferase